MSNNVRDSDVMREMDALARRPDLPRMASGASQRSVPMADATPLSFNERQRVDVLRGRSSGQVPTLKSIAEQKRPELPKTHSSYTQERPTAAAEDTFTRWQRFKASVTQCFNGPKPAPPHQTDRVR